MAALLAGLSVWGLANELPRFGDPCHTWGLGSSHSETIRPGDACQARSGSGETALQAALRLVLVQGMTLAASLLAVWGSLASRPWPLLGAGALMAGEAVLLLLGISMLFLLAGAACALYLLAGLRIRRARRIVPL